ncbi:oxygenase MpaB family protein [Nocardia sp. CDC153]|uniref:oxygenase MpaB family protein n=1 Tax=Nocardia sp. CDC153 TaxID=3112167 RepID=UPI002DBBFC42|nr:oxygenase MpaB family protein [Nocardia sp. CDC153]MEC3952124.1 oxygenase MpaB family protein [Nocardia sp. CDC153]
MTAPLRKFDEFAPAYEPMTPETVREHLDGVAAFLGGAANVVMQLSLQPVGHGVMESDVDSGKVMLHPIKRLRTTLTYLSVALIGTEDDRRDYREAVNRSHRSIRSKPGSTVKYNAFDPKLQLWVAACLYWGLDDLYHRMRGPMKPEVAEGFYRYCARLGTTLQMREDMWPATRDDFYAYWEEHLATKRIDEPTRKYFNDLIDLKMLPWPLRIAFGGLHRFIVTALLPPHLRDEMSMTWSAREERTFARLLRMISAVWTRMPTPIRLFPFNFYLADMRLRRRLGRPLV